MIYNFQITCHVASRNMVELYNSATGTSTSVSNKVSASDKGKIWEILCSYFFTFKKLTWFHDLGGRLLKDRFLSPLKSTFVTCVKFNLNCQRVYIVVKPKISTNSCPSLDLIGSCIITCADLWLQALISIKRWFVNHFR